MMNMIYSANDELEGIGEEILSKYRLKYEKEKTQSNSALQNKFKRNSKLQAKCIALYISFR